MSDKTKIVKVKLFIVLILFLGFVVIVRLIYLQLYKYDYYLELSKRQVENKIEVMNNRGRIFDRDGDLLAAEKKGASVFLYGAPVTDALLFKNALRQAGIYLDQMTISKLIKTRGFRWVKRGIDLSAAYRLQAGYPWIGIIKHELRFYPHKDLLANIIGFAGIDNQGLTGVEYQLDGILKLKKTSIATWRDSRGKLISLQSYQESVTKNVYLTIDSQIQRLAQLLLDYDTADFRAKFGFAAAMDVYTGDLLFAATSPTFDLNKYGNYPKQLWKNKLTEYLFEPGSIFKPIVFSFLVENGLINEHEIINCEKGSYKIHGNIINDVHPYDHLNVYDVIVHSSNIGMAKLAGRIKPAGLALYLKKAGFGVKTNIFGLSEETGLVRNASEWSKLSKYSISFGQEILITPLQILRFYAAAANEGFLVKPRIINKIDPVGEFYDSEYKRLFSAATSGVLKTVLKETVERGTGRNAKLSIFDVAGKTGTAQKFNIETRRYSRNEFVASFIGFFPVNKPKYVMMVLYDAPKKSIYGGSTAAFTFKKIAEQIAIFENIGIKQLLVKNEG